MVYARALRALECITHAGSSPALGTIGLRFISECSAVGSAPRLGRGGRRFESCHSDTGGYRTMVSIAWPLNVFI